MQQHRSRFLSRAVAAACFLGTLVFGATSHAQDALPSGTGFDLHLFRPAVDSKGLFTINGTDILGAGDVSFGLVADFGVNLARVGNSMGNTTTPLVSSLITGTFHGNVGIGNVLVLGAQVPVVLASGPTNTVDPTSMVPSLGIPTMQYHPGTGGLNFQGVGDIVIHAKLRWLRAEYYPVGLAIILQAGFAPMSGPANFAGEPGPWIWPSVALERRFGHRFRMDLNLGFRMFLSGTGATLPLAQTTTMMPAQVTYGPSITFGLGASYRIGTFLDLIGEVYGAQYVNGFDNLGATTPIEGVLGAKIFVEHNSYLMLGIGTRFTDAIAAADVRAFLGFIYEPSIPDSDGDGYRDDVDRCPFEPEDFDGFEDDDGCPDPDNDRDGIPDVDDQCPNVPGDHTGVGPNDGCPHNVIEDRDGDGIPDNVDRCPDDPEDRDGFQDDDGCPDPDNDNDGILDADDLCPNEPEDFDGFEDEDGCPDPDNDHDGIPDVRDQCPNEPETYNGIDDEDGCPDNGLLVVNGPEIRLNQQILFETDSAQVVDNDNNRNIIEQMSSLLRGHAEYELVEVEGHTDERAADDHNLLLSRDRANSVMQALIAHGIAANRLVAAGYGEYCPVNPQHNEAAWALNRRVQFLIIRQSPQGRTTAVAGCARGRQYIPPTVGPPHVE